MIYTVTFNPAIDYVVGVDSLKKNSVNRASSENIYFGGKGINVSMILHELEVPSVALGFVAGFTGEAIENGLRSSGMNTDFIKLSNGFSRINVKINSSGETELNGNGPFVSDDEKDRMLAKFDALTKGDILILAGSVPASLPADIYETILKKVADKEVITVVDATKNLLLNCLKYRPFLIKPNNFELEEMFEVSINSDDEIIFYAKKLQELGACNVLVSMAENGAILLDCDGNIHKMEAPKGEVINSVCAGDSMLAGFIAGYLDKNDYSYALKLGSATGSATAFSYGLGKRADIDRIMAEIS